jgi:hypothetical protein
MQARLMARTNPWSVGVKFNAAIVAAPGTEGPSVGVQ